MMKYNFLSGLKLNGTVLQSYIYTSCVRCSLETKQTRPVMLSLAGENGRSEAILFFAQAGNQRGQPDENHAVFSWSAIRWTGTHWHTNDWSSFLLQSWIFLVYDKITAMLTACLSYDSTSNCKPLIHATVLISSTFNLVLISRHKIQTGVPS